MTEIILDNIKFDLESNNNINTLKSTTKSKEGYNIIINYPNNKPKYLNEKVYLNHLGKKFNDKFIQRILICNMKEKNKQYHDLLPNSSKVLLSGLLICKYCGQPMKTDYSYKDYIRKTDGELTRMITYRYRCFHGKNKITYHPKTQVGAKNIDLQIENIIIDLIKKIDLSKIENNAEDIKNNKLNQKNNELSNLQKILQKKQKDLNVLNDEIPKSLLGESHFSPEILNKSIHQTETDINNLIENIALIKQEILNIEDNVKNINQVKDILYNWEDKFRNADIDAKKVLLSNVISNIVWSKDDLEINFKEFIYV